MSKPVMIIDPEDEHLVKDKTVHYTNGYPTVWNSKMKKSELVHRLIMHPIPEGMEVDHVNRVRHDNRRSNLRIVDHQGNMLNRKGWGKSLRGVYFDKTHKRAKPYKACKKINGKTHNLGYFSTEEEAHQAYMNYTGGA